MIIIWLKTIQIRAKGWFVGYGSFVCPHGDFSTFKVDWQGRYGLSEQNKLCCTYGGSIFVWVSGHQK